jgi:hypothetical protein
MEGYPNSSFGVVGGKEGLGRRISDGGESPAGVEALAEDDNGLARAWKVEIEALAPAAVDSKLGVRAERTVLVVGGKNTAQVPRFGTGTQRARLRLRWREKPGTGLDVGGFLVARGCLADRPDLEVPHYLDYEMCLYLHDEGRCGDRGSRLGGAVAAVDMAAPLTAPGALGTAAVGLARCIRCAVALRPPQPGCSRAAGWNFDGDSLSVNRAAGYRTFPDFAALSSWTMFD